MADSVREIVKGTSVVFFGMVIGTASEFLTRIVTARYLQPDEYGMIVLGFTILNVGALVAVVGTPSGLAKQLPRSQNQSSIFTGSLLTVMLLGGAIASVLYLTRGLTQELLKLDSFIIMVIFVFGIPFFSGCKVIVGGFRGLGKADGKLVVQNISIQFARVVLIGGAVYFGFDSTGIATVWVMPLVLAFLIGTLMIHLRSSLLTSNFYTEKSEIKSLLWFSFPLMISGAIWLLLQHTDNLIVASFVGTREVGVYNAAFTIGRSFLLIPAVFGFLQLPLFSEAEEDGRYNQMKDVYTLITKWMVFVSLPAYIFILFNRRWVLFTAFGPEYAGGSLALVVVVTGFFSHAFFGVNGSSLVAIEENIKVLAGNVVAFVSNTILNLSLIPILGIVGAAVASAISYIIANVYWTAKLYASTGIQPLSKGVAFPAIGTIVIGTLFLYSLPRSALFPLYSGISISVIHGASIILFGGIGQKELEVASELPILGRFSENKIKNAIDKLRFV